MHASLHICVFCASSMGANPRFREAAAQVGAGIAQRGWGLVYGGASVGLMGAVADAALAAGAPVTGVLPAVLQDREVAHHGLTEMHFVGSMHERKALMAERSDAFLAMPGGFGTLDELCEIVTWAQLGIHSKPIVLLNLESFYDSFLAFLSEAVAQEFIRARYLERLVVATSIEAALAAIEERLDAAEP